MVKKYSKPTKTHRNITSTYLSEKVNYGGEMVTRGYMIADLQKLARSYYPKDKRKQAALVEVYLRGKK